MVLFLPLCFAALIILLVYLHHWLRRKRIEQNKLKWKPFIEKEIYFYKTLNEAMKDRFVDRVTEFLELIPLRGFDTEINDLDRLYVAASAIIPTMGFDNWTYHGLQGVVILDGALPHEEKDVLVSGQVSSDGRKCIVTLSRQALYTGFENIHDKKNVGIHEFTHVLDQLDGNIDGVPSLCMPPKISKTWLELVRHEIKRIRKHHSSIDTYAGTNEVEFFAVVSEYFFEKPDRLKKEHPKIYELMSQAYRQNIFESFVKLLPKPKPKIKIGRNQPCPCGSGEKFKHCCLLKTK
jgi:Mlc titration factor MtfA (ptsG expression regulator)